jgi:hypothetical protein
MRFGVLKVFRISASLNWNGCVHVEVCEVGIFRLMRPHPATHFLILPSNRSCLLLCLACLPEIDSESPESILIFETLTISL